jgi:hypothetical protein
MDVYSTELEIRLSFVKTSEFRGGGALNHPLPPRTPPPRHATSISPIIATVSKCSHDYLRCMSAPNHNGFISRRRHSAGYSFQQPVTSLLFITHKNITSTPASCFSPRPTTIHHPTSPYHVLTSQICATTKLLLLTPRN